MEKNKQDKSCKTPRWRLLKDELNNIQSKQFTQFICDFPSVKLIDVRTKVEYDQGHIEGAINMDYFSEDFLERMESLSKNETYLIYCRSGRRSLRVCTWMKNSGFIQRNIYNLDQGYHDLIQQKG